MTSKEFLTQGYRLQDKINSLYRQLNSIECGMTAPNYEQIGGHSCENVSQTELRAFKSLELRQMIENEIVKLDNVQKAIFQAINGLSDINEQLVLRYRYIELQNGMPPNWDYISLKLHFSKQQTLRIHGKALEHLEYDNKCY